MDDRILDKVSLDLHASWLAVKETIGHQLLDGSQTSQGEKLQSDLPPVEPLMVPHLNESLQYSLYSVFIKLPQSKMDKLRKKPKTMVWAGHLNELLRRDVADKDLFKNTINDPKKVPGHYNADYEYQASDRRVGGIKKQVNVRLQNCEHQQVDPLLRGRTIQINPNALGFQTPKALYIIQNVWLVKGYNMQVIVGDRSAETFNTSQVPIAFTYKKYPLMPGNVLGIPKKPPNMRKARNHIWLRKSEFRLADDQNPLPMVDPDDVIHAQKRNPDDALPPLPADPTLDRSKMPLPEPPSTSRDN